MGRKRTKQIVIRMSDVEYKTVKSKVEKSGMSQQGYLIKAVTGQKIINTDGARELAKQVKPIGVNINQLVKNYNTGYPIRYDAILKIDRELNEVWQLLRQLIAGQASDTQSTTSQKERKPSTSSSVESDAARGQPSTR